MGFICGSIGYRILRAISPHGRDSGVGQSDHEDRASLDMIFGQDFWDDVIGKDVIDFGCGAGGDAIEMAKRGARHVVGVDIRDGVLSFARKAAEDSGVTDCCVFVREANANADTIISIDAFEHFEDPGGILELMGNLMHPNGAVWISFGPPWYHPRGGHLFSVFPWAHLVFTESSLLRWRSDFKSDGATRFSEVEGGLNQMTISRFAQLIDSSPFQIERFEAVPIHRLRFLANRITREFLSSIVRCKLVLGSGNAHKHG